QFMDTFTKQMGYPLVSVVDMTDTGKGRKVTLKQKKFWADPSLYGTEHAASNANYKWVIPLTFCKGSKPNEPCHFEIFDGQKSDTTEILVPDVKPDEWLKVRRCLFIIITNDGQ